MTANQKASGPRWRFGSHFAWAASLFLAGLGAKLGLIFHYGRSFPYLDQWPGEAIELFVPYFSGHFSVGTLFHPHNEHWIVFTRLCDLILLQLNGQWDGLLEMTVGAVIHCAGVAGLGWLMASLLGRKSWRLLWPVLFLDLALPFAWENTLWGFQNQFYFLQIFAWLTIWLLGLHKAWSLRWWLGAVIALAGVFAMAPGFLAAAAVIAITGLQFIKQRQDWPRLLPTWILCAVVVALGLALKLSLPTDYATQAHTAGDFLRALGKGLAWPWATRWWFAPLNLVPLGLLGWAWLRRTGPLKPAEFMTLGLGIWVGLQALAGAYARGNGGYPPAWRYMDSLSFLAITNSLALFLLLGESRAQARSPLCLRILAVCWALGCLGGAGYLATRAWTEFIPSFVVERENQLKTARDYIATNDRRTLENQPDGNRPVPNIDADVWLLGNPVVRGILPACARQALRVAPSAGNSDAFVRNGWLLATPDDPNEVSWGSYSAQKEAARGVFESQPLPASSLPYLEIPLAGDLGAPGLSLELVELNGGRIIPVRPPEPLAGQWVNARVKAPAGPFKIVARDDSDTKWFAFKEPREMGRLSFWTLRLLAAWPYLLVLGIGGFLLNLVRSAGNVRQSASPAIAQPR